MLIWTYYHEGSFLEMYGSGGCPRVSPIRLFLSVVNFIECSQL